MLRKGQEKTLLDTNKSFVITDNKIKLERETELNLYLPLAAHHRENHMYMTTKINPIHTYS